MAYYLAVDVGGTNTFIGVVEIKQKQSVKPLLVYTVHHATPSIKDFTSFFTRLVSYTKQKYLITSCVIGAAGIIQGSKVQLVNARITFDTKVLSKKTNIPVYLMNDFQALSLGIPFLDRTDIVILQNGKQAAHSTKAVIGAGTGLGKAILCYDAARKKYISLPSEGGHADLPLETELDTKLAQYIKSFTNKHNYPTSYEEVLSGRGLALLYQFIRETQFKEDKQLPARLDASEIAQSQEKNLCSRKTMKFFVHYYACCSRNFALEVLPTGGLYLAGGIAVRNPEIFKQYGFISEFQKHSHPQYGALLKQIPIFIIKTNLVSLLGAATVFEK